MVFFENAKQKRGVMLIFILHEVTFPCVAN